MNKLENVYYLTKDDLREDSKKVNINNITVYHFLRELWDEIKVANMVLYFGEAGKTKVIKNRYGNSNKIF